MKVFKYVIKDEQGKLVEDYFWAESIDEVALHLQQKKFYILSITEDKEHRSQQFVNKGKWKLNDIIDFSYQMSLMLEAGISIRHILDMLIRQKKKGLPYEFIKEGVQRGQPLSLVLKELHFPKIAVSLLFAGEMSGNLGHSFRLIKEYYEKERKLRQDIIASLSYPLFLVFTMICFALGMVLFIIPSFAEVFNSMGVELPALTALVFSFSHTLETHFSEMLIGGGLGLIFLGMVIRYSKINICLEEKIWLWLGPFEFWSGIYYGRLTNIWSILLDSGINISTTLEITADLWNNSYAQQLHWRTKDSVEKGNPLHKALQENKLGSTLLWEFLYIGEESGELVAMLKHLATYYDEKNSMWRKKVQQILEPLILSVMGIGVGFLVITVMLPMFNAITAISNL